MFNALLRCFFLFFKLYVEIQYLDTYCWSACLTLRRGWAATTASDEGASLDVRPLPFFLFLRTTLSRSP